jgi:hypothetical protein
MSDTPRTDEEGLACVTINGMSAVTSGSYVRLFQLSKALEQTLADLGKMNAGRIAEQLNRDTEKERNDLRAELISAHGENEGLRTELAALQRELSAERANSELDELLQAVTESSLKTVTAELAKTKSDWLASESFWLSREREWAQKTIATDKELAVERAKVAKLRAACCSTMREYSVSALNDVLAETEDKP